LSNYIAMRDVALLPNERLSQPASINSQVKGVVVVDSEKGVDVSTPASSQATLNLIVGNQIFLCRDGDSLGLNGTIAAELFQELSGAAETNLVFRLNGDRWWVEIPASAPPVAQVDDKVIVPGKNAELDGDHLIQVAGFRLRAHVTPPVTETPDYFQVQIETAFSRAASWVDRTLLGSDNPNVET
jgi:hypothetical protein